VSGGGQKTSIDCCMARLQQALGLSSSGAAARRSAVNVGSAVLRVEGGG